MLSLELGVAAGNQVALRTGPFWGWTVGRRHQRHGTRPVRRVRRADCAAQVKTRPRTITRRFGQSDRKSLLLCTALASHHRRQCGGGGPRRGGPRQEKARGGGQKGDTGPRGAGGEGPLEEADRYRLLQLRPVL